MAMSAERLPRQPVRDTTIFGGWKIDAGT